MKREDYNITLLVDKTPQEAFKSINSVTRWWTDDVEGNSKSLGDEFTVRFGDVHMSTQKLVEVIPNKKVAWLVTESKLNFIDNKKEWTNTKIIFEITEKNGQTQIRFTHEGLVPNQECFNDCSNAWNQYLQKSLFSLIITGKGHPTVREVPEQRKKSKITSNE